MNKIKKLFILISLVLNIFNLKAQDTIPNSDFDKFSFSYGIGMEHGGLLGINLLWYPQKNIGVFGGGGFNFPGFGYNLGLKARYRKENQKSNFSPYLMAMYGVNAGITIENYEKYNKKFIGTTFGAGIDFGPRIGKNGYFTAGILFPIRKDEVEEYVEFLKTRGFRFKNDFTPITFSFGLKFILSRHD
jgi:hypothetical protein